ncbi:MAG: DUF58 domain-containing protein [Acidobacteria bacterium]|nr:DUF58 domain-containing protein [Acidobacteriota bacterium]
MNRQAIRDFFITVFFLGLAFVVAMLSSIAADQYNPQLAAIAAGISLLLAAVGAAYIIPRLARNIRLEMLRFAVRTTVTVEGVLFVVFLVVIGFAAWNTGNNLLYLVLSAMIAFLIAANFIGRVSIGEVSVQLRFPDHIYAGEPANITVSVTNHKHLMPSYSFVVEALSAEDDEFTKARREIAQPRKSTKKRAKPKTPKRQAKQADDKSEVRNTTSHAAAATNAPTPPDGHKKKLGKLAYFLVVPAQASARQRIQHTFVRRGRYQITGFRIATKFPAGFFKKWRRIDASGEIIVYPNPQTVDDFYQGLPMIVGQIQSHTRGSGDELYAIRQYQSSDQMRHIDWKATAKSTRLMVRETTREDERRLTIVFDTVQRTALQGAADAEIDDHLAEPFAEQFERAIIHAASLARHFIVEQADVELIATDESYNVRSGSGHEHLHKILRSLAMLEPTVLEKDDEAAANAPSRHGLLRRFFTPDANLYDDEAVTDPEARAKQAVDGRINWQSLDAVPLLTDERRFKVLITSAAKGSIPASVWRSAHVVYMEDL